MAGVGQTTGRREASDKRSQFLDARPQIKDPMRPWWDAPHSFEQRDVKLLYDSTAKDLATDQDSSPDAVDAAGRRARSMLMNRKSRMVLCPHPGEAGSSPRRNSERMQLRAQVAVLISCSAQADAHTSCAEPGKLPRRERWVDRLAAAPYLPVLSAAAPEGAEYSLIGYFYHLWRRADHFHVLTDNLHVAHHRLNTVRLVTEAPEMDEPFDTGTANN